jgi:hypothetical protein
MHQNFVVLVVHDPKQAVASGRTEARIRGSNPLV